MKVRYFEDTDTLYIELRDVTVAQTQDIDDNTVVDLDDDGQLVAITIEHAQARTELSQFVYERIAA